MVDAVGNSAPTASREDLQRDDQYRAVQHALLEALIARAGLIRNRVAEAQALLDEEGETAGDERTVENTFVQLDQYSAGVSWIGSRGHVGASVKHVDTTYGVPGHAHEPDPLDPDAAEEGVFIGYRHYDRLGIAPMFPFGFGLSYSDFALSNLSVDASRFDAEPAEEANVVGCLCTPLDRLADKAMLPHAEVGDLVAVFCAGAYGASASPANFLGQGPARELLV